MSFRHTCITGFIYKFDHRIFDVLCKYGNFTWRNVGLHEETGYFHGVLRDLDNHETREHETEIVQKLKELGVDIKIVYES